MLHIAWISNQLQLPCCTVALNMAAQDYNSQHVKPFAALWHLYNLLELYDELLELRKM